MVVPPDFINEETSGDVDVTEGGSVKLTCKAKGNPEPTVQWRREDGEEITLRDMVGKNKGKDLIPPYSCIWY